MLMYTISRPRTWLTATCLSFGILGLLALEHTLSEHRRCLNLQQMARYEAEPPPEVEHDSVWCADETRCFVDLAALERERLPLPRGLRLVPNGDGLRIDGARGLLARLDLRNGDVLRAVDDTPLRDGSDMSVMLKAITRGEFVLHVRRGEVDLPKRITIVRPAV